MECFNQPNLASNIIKEEKISHKNKINNKGSSINPCKITAI